MFVKIHKKVLLEEWAVSIGSQVAKRRRELRLTQQNLAEKMGVSFQAISSWEREEFLPDINKLQKLNPLNIRRFYFYYLSFILNH